MYKKLALMLMLLLFASNPAYADNRFSRQLEYALMDECVGDAGLRAKQIEVCERALQKTQEGGWFGGYADDDDFRENRNEFIEEFNKNIEQCWKEC